MLLKFPLRFFQGYLLASVILYAFGPWPWPTKDPLLLYSFLAVVIIALSLGYTIGIRSRPKEYTGPLSIHTLIVIGVVTNAIWAIPNFLLRTQMDGFSSDSVTSAVVSGYLNPGEAYQDKIKAASEVSTTPLLGYVSQALSPLLWIMTPLCVFYWKVLDFRWKLVFVLCALMDLLSWVAIGTNKGIFDFALTVPWIILASKPHWLAHLKLSRVLLATLAAFLLGSLLFAQFASSIRGRGGGEIAAYDSSAQIRLDRHNWLIAELPTDLQDGVGALTSYLSQGYYPLSLALTEPFVFSYGVGNSYYYTGIAQSFTGPDTISDLTYPARIESYGWSRLAKWHTFYTWLASDVSFFGVPVLVFLIGWMFASVWRDCLSGTNPLAVALLPLVVLMLFYFPANNQVLGFSRTANAFIVLVPFWLFYRRSPFRERRGIGYPHYSVFSDSR